MRCHKIPACAGMTLGAGMTDKVVMPRLDRGIQPEFDGYWIPRSSRGMTVARGMKCGREMTFGGGMTVRRGKTGLPAVAG